MKKIVFVLVSLFIMVGVIAILLFDSPRDAAFLGCSFNGSTGCEVGSFTFNSSDMEAADYVQSGSWCNSSTGFQIFNGTDAIEITSMASILNVTNFSIVIGFRPYNVTKFGGIVSLFDNNISTASGWAVRTTNDSFIDFRYRNASGDLIVNFDENNHTGISAFQNYTLVLTFDGDFLRVWLNNTQIEKISFVQELLADSASKLKLGFTRTTANLRYEGEIHFIYLYNYTLTPQQVVNRTRVICGEQLFNLTSQRFGVMPLTNVSVANLTSAGSLDRVNDPYNYRVFPAHANTLDFHRGIDFGNRSGLPIYAVMNGTVVFAENVTESNASAGRSRFGNWVFIEHSPDPDTGQPRHTVYLHLNDSPTLTENVSIEQGAFIGYTGQSGEGINSPHLHFELVLDANEDSYANRTAMHPFRIFNFTDGNQTNVSFSANDTTYFVNLSHNFNDLDFVKIKFVGSVVNRTIDYQTKEGLEKGGPDVSCADNVCFLPTNWSSPFPVYNMTFAVNKNTIGILEGVVWGDTNGNELTAEPTRPSVTINSPTNGSFRNTSNVILNVTVIDAESNNMTVFFLGNGSVIATNKSVRNNTVVTFNWTQLTDGRYNWTVIAFDQILNSTPSNFSFTVDLIQPTVTYNADTTAEGSQAGTTITINVTVSDTNLDTVLLVFDGTTETFDSVNGNVYFEQKTSLVVGAHTFFVRANDSAGNTNQSVQRNVTITTVSGSGGTGGGGGGKVSGIKTSISAAYVGQPTVISVVRARENTAAHNAEIVVFEGDKADVKKRVGVYYTDIYGVAQVVFEKPGVYTLVMKGLGLVMQQKTVVVESALYVGVASLLPKVQVSKKIDDRVVEFLDERFAKESVEHAEPSPRMYRDWITGASVVELDSNDGQYVQLFLLVVCVLGLIWCVRCLYHQYVRKYMC